MKFGSAHSSFTTFGSLIFPLLPAVPQVSIYCLVVENQKSQLVNVVSKAAEKCVPIVKTCADPKDRFIAQNWLRCD